MTNGKFTGIETWQNHDIQYHLRDRTAEREKGKTFVCYKHDMAITSEFCPDHHLTILLILVYYKEFCLKEGKVSWKIFQT